MNEGTVVVFPKMFSRPRITIADLQGRLGRFVIADVTLDSWPDMVLQVMGQVIVLQAGRCDHGHTSYLAISEHFDRMEDTRDMPPAYEWRFEEGRMRPHRI